MIFTQFAVIYDACVLYPAPLRDLLMHLAMTGLFRAKWTNHIQDEWITSLLRTRPDLTLTQLTRTRQLMDLHVLDALVEDYEHLIDRLVLPDPADRHVLAAAIASKSSLIVTWNLKHFPEQLLKPYGTAAVSPDDFVMDQIDLSADLVMQAIRRHKDSLRSPALTWMEYLENLEKQGLSKTVTKIKGELLPQLERQPEVRE